MKKQFIILFLGLFVNTILSFSADVNNLYYRTYTQKDGLASNTVFSIEQDSEGLLYFGTTRGLSVFDGNIFLNYSLPIGSEYSNITSIVELDEMHMLIGTSERGLFIFDKGKEDIREVNKNNHLIQNVKAVVKKQDSSLWVGCSNGSLWYIDDYRELYNDNIDSSTFIRVSYYFSAINAMIEYEEKLLVASNDNDIISVSKGQGTVLVEKVLTIPSAEKCYSFLSFGENYLWIGTDQGVEIVKTNSDWTLVDSIQTFSNGIYSMTRYRNKVYLVSGKKKMQIITLGKQGEDIIKDIYLWNTSSDLTDSAIKIDDSGVLWLGWMTDGVLKSSLNSNLFQQIKGNSETFYSLSKNVTSMCQLQARSQFYVGAKGEGIYFYDGSFRIPTIKLINESVKDFSTIYTDDKLPFLYIGTLEHGLKRLNKSNNKLDSFSPIELDKRKISYIGRMDSIHLFIGTSLKGAWILNEQNGRLTPIIFPTDSLIDMEVSQLLKIGKSYWMATIDKGLIHFDLDENLRVLNYKQYKEADKRSMQIVSLCHNKNQLWISMYNGLAYIDLKEKDISIKRVKSLEEYSLGQLVQLENGDLWISSYSGLILYQPDKQIVNKYLTDYIHWKIFYDSNKGELFSASSSGLFVFRPHRVLAAQEDGKVLIRALFVNGERVLFNDENKVVSMQKSISYADTLILAPGNRNVSFILSALSFVSEVEPSLFYRMEGLDEEWNKAELSATPNVIYRNLPPGKYMLKIRLNNPENLEGEKNLWIEQKEYWWKTWMAITFFIIVVIAFIGDIIYHYYIQHKIRIEHRMKELVIRKDEEIYQQRMRFFTNISHDLKTPLTLLLSPLYDLMNKKDIPEIYRNQLQSMGANGEILLRKFNNILNYKNTEGLDSELSIQKCLLRNLLFEMVMPFKEYAERQGLSFSMDDTQIGDSCFIETDRNKLESIFENLLSNAIKYTPENGSISVICKENKGMFTFIISDTGVGISEQNLPCIFNRDYRIAADNQGTGIGLYLVKHYVDLLGGIISVNSVLNKGTSFNVSIPFEQLLKGNDKDFNPKESVDILKQEVNGSYSQLLIVDDNKEMRAYLNQIFSENKYQVVEMADGKHALAYIQENLPDLILSDWMMPGMDGLSLCRQVKGNVLTSHIPFVMLTARNTKESRLESWEAGVDLFEEKPFNSQLLLIKVANLLKSRRLLKYKYQIALPNISKENVVATALSLDEKFLQEVKNAIDKYKDQPDLSISDLANELNIGHDQLYRKLKALTGLSVNQYIRTYRLNCAAAMLRSKKYMVTEVLYHVGFNNPSYFTKCFKKEFGVLPSDFLEQIDQNSEFVSEN